MGQGTQRASQAVTDRLPPPRSFFAKVAGLFVSPSRTFQSIALGPQFAAPFIAVWVLFAGFWAVVYAKWGLPGMAVAVVQFFRHGTEVRPDEIEFALQFSRALAPAILIGGTVAILVHLFIVSWIGSRLADLFWGIRPPFRTGLTLACYAYLARSIAQTLLGAGMLLFGGLDGLNFGNLVPTNVAFFLDPGSRILYAFLQSLDVVQLWYFTLLAIGFSTLADERKEAPIMGAGFAALWIVWNVFLAAFGEVLHAP